MELYNKYRPKTFDEVVGNETTVDSLVSMLKRDDPPKAYLFLGPYGCGKTTFAYLVRDFLGCDPIDFHEVDSGQFGGVDFVREVRDMMRHRPQKSRYNVWFFDECHNLSAQAQDALLKEVEDGSKSSIVILASTEDTKIKKTLRSRCAEFWVKQLNEKQLGKMMWGICRQEKKKVEKAVLKQIVQDCGGSARTALMILDAIIDMPPEKMAEAAARQADQENETIELCRSLLKGENWPRIAQILKGLSEDPEKIRRAVLGYCQAVLLNAGNSSKGKRAAFIMDIFRENFFSSGKAGLVLACYEVYFDTGA